MTGRRTQEITIKDENRDKGKTFLITEMSSRKAERWAWKVLLVLGKSGVDVGDIAGAGMAGLASLGVEAIRAIPKISYEDLGPILDEMEQYIQFVPNINDPRPRIILENEVEEWSTWLTFRMEFIKLHTVFSPADSL